MTRLQENHLRPPGLRKWRGHLDPPDWHGYEKKAQIARKKRLILSWIVSFCFPRFPRNRPQMPMKCLWNHGCSKPEDLKFWYPRIVFQLGPWKQKAARWNDTHPSQTEPAATLHLYVTALLFPTICACHPRMNRINKDQWLDLESGVKPHF